MQRDNFGYIYKTTSLLDGRIYIGQKRGVFTSNKKMSRVRKGKNLAGFTREHFVNMVKKRGAPWNKGLTKETSPLVAQSAMKKIGHTPWNKGKIKPAPALARLTAY